MRRFKSLQDFYNSDEWKRFREIVIAERLNEYGETIDEITGKVIVNKYDIILHHVIELTMLNVNDVSISLNPSNIKIVSFKTHNEIHKRFGYDKQNVYVVHGSPLSGKTTWVEENAGIDDLIIDIDKIWQMLSINQRYIKSKRIAPIVFNVRDFLIDQVKIRASKFCNCYVIGSYPLQTERQRLCDILGARAIHINTSKEECINRLMEDTSGRDKEEWLKYINKYWDTYTE